MTGIERGSIRLVAAELRRIAHRAQPSPTVPGALRPRAENARAQREGHLDYKRPNTSFACPETRTNVVRFENSRSRRAPT